MKRRYKSRHFREDDLLYDIGYRESGLGDELYKNCQNHEEEDKIDSVIDTPPHITKHILKWHETRWEEGPWAKPQIANEDTTDFKNQLDFEEEYIEKYRTNNLIL